MQYYFICLSWFGGYVSGYTQTQYGPFANPKEAEKIRAWIMDRRESSNRCLDCSEIWEA